MQPELSNEERLRYSRQMILPEVSLPGQQRLKAAKVLLIGTGGLGSPAALYLAAAGVGQIGLVDFDRVDLTNLHRQIIHGTPDVGRNKLDSAAESMTAVNPNVQVVKHETMLTRDNALPIIRDYDFVVDGTDNFPTRYLVNDACVLLGKPNMYGSILGFEGQATVFCAPNGPCYRCLFPEPPPPGSVPSCAEGGVLGVLPGVIGLIQATETVKAIVQIGELLVGRLLLYSALTMRFSEVRIRRDPDCPMCGDHPTITELADYNQLCGLPGRGEVSDDVREIEPEALMAMRKGQTRFDLIDVREPHEYAISRIPGSTLIPLGQLAGRQNEVDRSKTAVIYCRTGVRSAHACRVLQKAGFNNAVNLRGGIVEWTNQHGEVEP